MITPILNDFFQLLGNKAGVFLPSNILKYWDRFNNRLLSLKPFKVMCCWIVPNSFIVETYSASGAKNNP